MTTPFRIKGVLRNGIRLRNSARTELSRIPNASFLVLSTDATTANNIRPNHPKIPTRSVSSAQIARPVSSFSSEAASTTNDINSGSGLDPEIEEMNILSAADSNEQLSVGTMDRTAIREARFNILRNCKHPTKESAHQAQKKLEELARESILIGKQLANVAIYNNVLDATAKCGVMTGFRKANELLEKMHERHEAHPHCSPAPNTISYHCVLDACARSSANKHTEAAKKADELIKKMEELSQAHPDGNVHPETRSYDMVIMAHAHQAPLKYGAANAAEDWLRYLSKLNTEGGAGPSSNTFNFVLQAWKSSPEDKGADRALELLHLMIKLNREGHHEQVRPCERSFANVIQAFANRNRPEEAEDVLKLALSFFLDTEFVSNYPKELVDVRRCFNIAINGWAKSSVPDAPERADSLLRDMRTLAQETLLVVADPDIFSHTSCMEALANSGRSDAPEIVESRLYSLLEEHSASHGNGLLPTPVMFDCVIRTWFRSDKENKADRMETLLNALIELAQRRKNNQLLPRPRTVNLCLNAWCRAGEAKGKALHLLNRMEVIGCTDSQSYLPMIESLLEESQQNGDSDSAYAAAVVLEKLQAQIKYRGKIEWPSDPVYLHNRVFMALRKIGTGAAADRAYALLDGMERGAVKRAKPSCKSYSVVISALANDPTPTRTKKALDIFDHLIRLHYSKDSKVKADQHSFHAILTCLSNTSERWAADQACSLIEKMATMYSESGNQKLMPNSMCYDRCLQAMARCGTLESVRDACKLLKKFVSDFQDARAPDLPSEAGINAVHKYCSLLEGEEAIKLANEVAGIKEDLERKGHLITYKANS